MKTYISIIVLSVLMCAGILSASANDSMAFHCQEDTIVIDRLLKDEALKGLDAPGRVAFFARNLAGSNSNLRSDILEADTMIFTVNVHEFSPLSFISTCVALAKAYESSSDPNWRDFAEAYENVMFKGGKAGDFASRFLYGSDWIVDNIFRGNVEDATQHIDGLAFRRKEKSIDYISHHKNSFKAFENPQNFERIKMLEMGFRNHQIPYISNGDLTNASRFKTKAKDGDIVFLLTPDFNLDHREMGILTWVDDRLMIVQLSPSADKVVMEELPFENYIKRNIKRIQGARIIRLK